MNLVRGRHHPCRSHLCREGQKDSIPLSWQSVLMAAAASTRPSQGVRAVQRCIVPGLDRAARRTGLVATAVLEPDLLDYLSRALCTLSTLLTPATA